MKCLVYLTILLFLGNQFTSLDGVEFEWSLKVVRTPIYTVLRFIPFKDSSYRTPPDLYELDQKNKQGHMVLVEGVKTGSALVCLIIISMCYGYLFF